MELGFSGGVWGLSKGYCLTVGEEEKVFRRLEPIFRTLAPPVATGGLLRGQTYRHLATGVRRHSVKRK